jgi:hypothetical protein
VTRLSSHFSASRSHSYDADIKKLANRSAFGCCAAIKVRTPDNQDEKVCSLAS